MGVPRGFERWNVASESEKTAGKQKALSWGTRAQALSALSSEPLASLKVEGWPSWGHWDGLGWSSAGEVSHVASGSVWAGWTVAAVTAALPR